VSLALLASLVERLTVNVHWRLVAVMSFHNDYKRRAAKIPCKHCGKIHLGGYFQDCQHCGEPLMSKSTKLKIYIFAVLLTIGGAALAVLKGLNDLENKYQ
jgi:hypothetical protein